MRFSSPPTQHQFLQKLQFIDLKKLELTKYDWISLKLESYGLVGKRHALLNGKGDRDSGHGDSDIETIMSSTSHGSEDARVTPEPPLTRSNSDVGALLSRGGRELRDKITRSRSIDPTKIQVSRTVLYL